MYANVIVDISHEKLDRIFQYAIPEALEGQITEGMVVRVPFGRGNKLINAFVIELTNEADFDVSRIKYIDGIETNKLGIEGKMINLAAFIRRTYGGTMNQALKTVIPVKDEVANKVTRNVRLLKDAAQTNILKAQYKKKNALAKVRLLESFCNTDILPYDKVTKDLKIPLQTIKAMVFEGIIEIESEIVFRGNKSYDITDEKKPLTIEQQQALDIILQDYYNEEYNTYLLHGITGSGKTEVYLNVIEKVLEKGRQVIMLIPEISLTFQTVRRFYQRFGDKVSIINSKLSKGERYDQMLRAKNGEVSIMIGPRSALFTPFDNIGLIIIDEEHEGAYKSENVPKYHAREVAKEIARVNNASLILGSATPSVESYYEAMSGKIKLLTLKNRAVDNSRLPKVYIEDLRKELKEGNKSIFSVHLQKLIQDRLKKNEQIMLFLNRRGYSNFISCRECGEVIKCPHCDVTLKLHNNNTLVCHYCSYRISMPDKCPKCNSKYIAGFGIGTQKVEENIKKMYPEARVLRMDYDTTKKKDDYDAILDAFANHEADILIGTQMIVKGHDFPKVTLVGIIAADISLYANDYRAGERTFELLVQASGRAGRANDEGEVIIQTYSPDNISIVTAAAQDYEAFYRQEIMFRELLDYPPVTNMLAIKISSQNESLCEARSAELADILNKTLYENSRLIGPSNASIYKMSDIFTNIVYIKDSDYNILTRYKDEVEKYVKDNQNYKNVTVQFDFNPMNM